MNYRACITLGYGRPELLNMTILGIGEHITDNHAWAEYVGKVRNYGYMLAERYKRKDGTTFPVEVNASIAKLGHLEYMVAVARDTIEREHAQIQLEESETIRKIAECTKDAIIMMGSKGEISFWNPAAERMFRVGTDREGWYPQDRRMVQCGLRLTVPGWSEWSIGMDTH